MKKFLLFILFALLAIALPAQEVYSYVYHNPGCEGAIYNTMQQRDGDFVMHKLVFGDDPTYTSPPLGFMTYKISPTTLTVTDSLFVADTTGGTYLFARDPLGEGNIRANFEYHEDCDSTFLRIRHFADTDLHPITGEDILVPICEGITLGTDGCDLFDDRGDLILRYYKERPNEIYDEYIARIGPDGTLKRQTLFQENSDWQGSNLRVLKDSPLQYYRFEFTDDIDPNLSVEVTDSLFHKNTVILNRMLRSEIIAPNVVEYEYLDFGNLLYTEVIPVGGNDVLVVAPYVHDTNFYPWHSKYGIAVARYDLRTMQMKKYIVFDEQITPNRLTFMGLKMMTDGTVYFAYKKNRLEPAINIVKMDADLNVEWNRFCKMNDVIIYSRFCHGGLFKYEQGEEKGIAWPWEAKKDGDNNIGLVLFLLNHDGTVGTNDMGIEVRPYAFYPNPANDYLRLQYSPDVEPAQIELYDLQGRLVRSQGSGLECLSLQGLAPGQYVMKVTMADGTTFSDKVVKE